jgi:hypothetical protein
MDVIREAVDRAALVSDQKHAALPVRRLTLNEHAFDDRGPGFLEKLVERDVSRTQPTWFLVNAFSAGDTYLPCALARQFRQLHCRSGQRLAMVVKEAHLPIAQMFEAAIDDIFVAPDDYLAEASRHVADHAIGSTFEPDRALFMRPDFADTPIESFGLIDGVSRAHLFAALLRLPFPPVLELPTIRSEWYARAEEEAVRIGLVPGRSVVLVPDANTWLPVAEAFWERLAERLDARGWMVFTNVAGSVRSGGRRAPFARSTAVDLPFGAFLPLVQKAGWVVGSVCGLMNLVVSAQTDCKKTFVARSPEPGTSLSIDGVALTTAYPYALQRTFDGQDYDVEYIDARSDLSPEALAEEVARGRNASFDYRAPRQPVLRMRLDMPPGDVVDRMTILEVKLERLPEAKRLTIFGELAALRQALTAAYGPLTGELKAAADRLRDLNRGAFDVNEVVYRDFDDPAFVSACANADIAGIESRVMGCITNMLRGVGFNRERILVKNRINALLNCDWMERRSFVDRG